MYSPRVYSDENVLMFRKADIFGFVPLFAGFHPEGAGHIGLATPGGSADGTEVYARKGCYIAPCAHKDGNGKDTLVILKNFDGLICNPHIDLTLYILVRN